VNTLSGDHPAAAHDSLQSIETTAMGGEREVGGHEPRRMTGQISWENDGSTWPLQQNITSGRHKMRQRQHLADGLRPDRHPLKRAVVRRVHLT
jgi:hypothetical protein